MMRHWFSHWIQNQKQTRRFHPSWILLVVVATIVVAGIIWIPAAVVTQAVQYDRLPAAELPAAGKTAVPAEEVPATRESWMPTRADPKTIRVEFPAPDRTGGGSRQT